MTQDSDFGCPEHIDDESDLEFAERYAKRLRDAEYPWGHDCETALHTAVAEIDRLRGELSYSQTEGEESDRLEARLVKEVERLRAELSEVVQMVDETFGPFAVMTSAEAIKHLSEGVFKWRQDYEKLRAENAALRDQRDKTVSLLAMSCTNYHGTTCLDPDDDGRPADIGSACNVCSIRAMLTGAGE